MIKKSCVLVVFLLVFSMTASAALVTEKNETVEMYETDLGLALPNFNTSMIPSESAVKLNTSILKHSVVLGDTEHYELTSEDMLDLVTELAITFKEDPADIYRNVKRLKDSGELYSEIDRLKKKHPVRTRLHFPLIKKSNPSVQDMIDKARQVRPDLLRTTIAVLQQSVSLDGAFDGDISLKKTSEGFNIIFPKDYNHTDGILHINLTTERGVTAGKLDVNADKDGEVTKMTLQSLPQRQLIKSARNRLVNIWTSVTLELGNLTADSGVRLTTYSIPDEVVRDRLERIADLNKFRIYERVGVMNVETYNLPKEVVLGAKVSFRFESNLLGMKRPDSVRIVRMTSNKTEILPTKYVGSDSDGNFIFEAESPGLSAFSAIITEGADEVATDKRAEKDSSVMTFLAVAVILMAVIGLAVSIIYRQRAKMKGGF